jgi:hypothetical protein
MLGHPPRRIDHRIDPPTQHLIGRTHRRWQSYRAVHCHAAVRKLRSG